MLSGENDQLTINDRFFDDGMGDEEEDFFFDIESLLEGNLEEYSAAIPAAHKELKCNIESKGKALMSQLVSSDTDSESSREKKVSTVSSDTDSESSLDKKYHLIRYR